MAAPSPTRPRPKVLFVTSLLSAVGGIPSYSRSVIAALEQVADVEVIDLELSGSRQRQVVGFVRAMALIVRRRPDLVLLGHVGMGPIGIVWQRFGGRYAVMAYGLEIWGPPSRLLDQTLHRADLVWPISTFTRAEVVRVSPGARTADGLGGTIEPSFFQDHEPTAGPFRIAFVATLADFRYKGADTLVEAGARLAADHDIDIRVIGSGKASVELEQHLEASGAQSFTTMVGRVDHEGLLEEYRRADALVLLTRFHRGEQPRGEGLGLVLLEAQAAETPVIGSCRGGSVDCVVEGVTGHLLEPGDVEGLERHLRRWIEDPALARKMGEAGRAFVQREHSFGAFAARVSAALDRSLGRGDDG